MSNSKCKFQHESFSKCPECKIEVAYDDQFCDQCGTKLEKLICNDCNILNRAIAKYCARCGSENLKTYDPSVQRSRYTEEDFEKLRY